MNVLGHVYVAWKATGRLNKYLVAGSHLPDLVPFVSNSVFTFEEIHESPEKVLRFLEKNYPHARDLALGMMAHSVKFGADKFNREIEKWLLKDNKKLKDELALEIAGCSGVSLKTARGYIIHNYLWGGIDVYLLKTKSKIVEELAETHREIDRKEIACLLAECFRKNEREVKRTVDSFLVPIKPEILVSLEGLVKIWRDHLAKLLRKDVVNEQKALRLFEKIYGLFEDKWEGVLEKVVVDVKKNLRPFVYQMRYLGS